MMFTQGLGMLFIMEKDVLPTPIGIARSGFGTVMSPLTSKTNLIKKLWFLVRIVWN